MRMRAVCKALHDVNAQSASIARLLCAQWLGDGGPAWLVHITAQWLGDGGQGSAAGRIAAQ